MSTSRIEWTGATWNPIVGCTRCSTACDHCYAVRMAHRLGSNPQTPQYKGLTRMTSLVIDLEHEGRALSKSDQVRLCGNSVCPPMALALVRANYVASLRESRDPLPLLAMGGSL